MICLLARRTMHISSLEIDLRALSDHRHSSTIPGTRKSCTTGAGNQHCKTLSKSLYIYYMYMYIHVLRKIVFFWFRVNIFYCSNIKHKIVLNKNITMRIQCIHYSDTRIRKQAHNDYFNPFPRY